MSSNRSVVRSELLLALLIAATTVVVSEGELAVRWARKKMNETSKQAKTEKVVEGNSIEPTHVTVYKRNVPLASHVFTVLSLGFLGGTALGKDD